MPFNYPDRREGIRTTGRLLAVLGGLGLLTVLALSGPTKAPAPVAPVAAGVTLRLWHAPRGVRQQNALLSMAADYASAHPGVHITVEAFEGEAYRSSIQTATGGGALPDIFEVYGGGSFLRPLVQAGRLADLSSLSWDLAYRSHVGAPVLDAFSVHDKLYAVPRERAVAVVWYNKRLFAQAGVTPPATVGAFAEVVAALNRAEIVPVAVAGRERWPVALWYWYLVDRTGGAPLIEQLASDRNRWTAPPLVEAGRRLAALFETGAFPPGFLGVDYAGAERQFATGQAAMYLMGSWAVGSIAPLGDDAGWFPFPALTGGGPGRFLGNPAHSGYAVSTDSPHKDLAVDFLRWLSSREQMARFAAAGWFLPAANLEVEELALPAVLKQVAQTAGDPDQWQVWWDQLLPPELSDVHMDAVVATAGGLVRPEQALAVLQAKHKR